jgi:hypothetical protein
VSDSVRAAAVPDERTEGAEVHAVEFLLPAVGDGISVVELNGVDVECEPARHDAPSRLQDAFTQIDQGLDHPLVEEVVADLLVDDDVDLTGRLEVAAVRPEELDAGDAVRTRDLLRHLDDLTVIDRVYERRPAFRGQEGEDAGPGAHVQDDIPGLHVLRDRLRVRIDPNAVREPSPRARRSA